LRTEGTVLDASQGVLLRSVMMHTKMLPQTSDQTADLRLWSYVFDLHPLAGGNAYFQSYCSPAGDHECNSLFLRPMHRHSVVFSGLLVARTSAGIADPVTEGLYPIDLVEASQKLLGDGSTAHSASALS
jgi:hypothetical protein